MGEMDNFFNKKKRVIYENLWKNFLAQEVDVNKNVSEYIEKSGFVESDRRNDFEENNKTAFKNLLENTFEYLAAEIASEERVKKPLIEPLNNSLASELRSLKQKLEEKIKESAELEEKKQTQNSYNSNVLLECENFKTISNDVLEDVSIKDVLPSLLQLRQRQDSHSVETSQERDNCQARWLSIKEEAEEVTKSFYLAGQSTEKFTNTPTRKRVLSSYV